MRITNLSVSTYGNGSFMVAVGEPEIYVHISLSEQETDHFRQLASEIFFSRQKDIAHEIGTASPTLLADFTEVKAAPVDNDLSF